MPYEDFDTCPYYINVHNAQRVIIFYNDFDSEVYKDSLTYGVGYTADEFDPESFRGLLWGNLTMRDALPQPHQVDLITFYLPGAPVWFEWRTDKNIMNRGFEIEYFTGKHEMMVSNLGQLEHHEHLTSYMTCLFT